MALVFELLFKYPKLVFEQGDFTFAASRSMMMTVCVLAALAGAALVTYRGITIEAAAATGWCSCPPARARRDAALLPVRPSLILKAAVPQQNFLGILIDDSRSMTIADRDGQPRTQFVQQQLGEPDSPLARRCRSASSCDSSASRRPPIAWRTPPISSTTGRRHGSDRRSSAPATSWRGCRWPAW